MDGVPRLFNLHRTEFKMSILSGDVSKFRGDREAQLNGWIAKYVYPDGSFPIEIQSFKFNGSKSVTVFLKRKEFVVSPEFESEYFTWMWDAVTNVKFFLRSKYSIVTGRPIPKCQHGETREKDFNKVVDKSKRVRAYLGTPAFNALGPLRDSKGRDVEEYVETDYSKTGNPSQILNLENNSWGCTDDLLRMPRRVKEQDKRLKDISRKIDHLDDVIPLLFSSLSNLEKKIK